MSNTPGDHGDDTIPFIDSLDELMEAGNWSVAREALLDNFAAFDQATQVEIWRHMRGAGAPEELFVELGMTPGSPTLTGETDAPLGGDAPFDGDDVDSVLATIEGMNPDEAWEWLTEHAGELSEEAFNAGQEQIQQSADGEGDAPPPDDEPAANLVGEEVADQQAYDDALDRAADYISGTWTGEGAQIDPDVLAGMAPDGLTASQQTEWQREALERGTASGTEAYNQALIESGVEDEQTRNQLVSAREDDLLGVLGTTTPRWLLERNGIDLSTQQKERFVSYWNDAYGTFYQSWDQLVPHLATFDGAEAEAQNMFEAVVTDQEPLISHSIELPLVSGRQRVAFTEDEMATWQAMGFSNDAITRVARLAAITSGPDSIRPGDAGPTLDMDPLMALVRYHGGTREFGAFNQTQQDIADIEQQLGLSPGEYNAMSFAERQEFIARQKAEALSPAAVTSIDDATGRLDGLLARLARFEEKGETPGIIASQNLYRRGLDEYQGDPWLAFIHAVDAPLARSIASSGGDPEKLDWRDSEAAWGILEQAGVVADQDPGRLSQARGSIIGALGFFEPGRAGRAGGGGGAVDVRRMLDPETVRQAAQQMWSRWFLDEVPAETVESMQAALQRMLDEAPEGQGEFNISARVEAFLKSQDLYDELYSNKPEGLSEEEYQAQFAGGIADMIGNEADPEALKAGMRTGQYNTAVGRAASSERLLTSSTLRGRWAQAKDTLDRFS